MKELAYIGYALMIIGLWFSILESSGLTWWGGLAGTGFCLFLLAAPFLSATHEVLREYKDDVAYRRRTRGWWR